MIRELNISELEMCSGGALGDIHDKIFGDFNYMGDKTSDAGKATGGLLKGNVMDAVRASFLGAIGGFAGGSMTGAKLAVSGGEIGGIIAEVVGFFYGGIIGGVAGFTLGGLMGSTHAAGLAWTYIGPALGGNI